MDSVVGSDEKLYISPPVHLQTFLEEATATEKQLSDFFRDAATRRRLAAAHKKDASQAAQATTSDAVPSKGSFLRSFQQQAATPSV